MQFGVAFSLRLANATGWWRIMHSPTLTGAVEGCGPSNSGRFPGEPSATHVPMRMLARHYKQRYSILQACLLAEASTEQHGTSDIGNMAANGTTSLPIIDFAKIIGPSISRSPEVLEESELEQQKLFQAFVDVGFCYLNNHSIPDYARDNLFSHAKRFFALPESEKAKVETGESKGFHGWFSPARTSGDSRHSDLKEAFDVGKENDPTRPNQWPEDWPEFRDDMNFFFEKCHEVHLVLLRALARQVGVDENFFEPHVNEKDHFFRVIYYPETSRTAFQDRLRASAHTDYGTLTLLFNDESGGLQVRRTDGTYIAAPPIPGCAIINVGDLLSRWFNDRLVSTEHRVVEPEPKTDITGQIPAVVPARYSIAWFGHPNREALVEPIDKCCTADNPKKYGPVYAGKHVVERLAYLHKKGQNTTTWTDKMQRGTDKATDGPAPQPVAAGGSYALSGVLRRLPSSACGAMIPARKRFNPRVGVLTGQNHQLCKTVQQWRDLVRHMRVRQAVTMSAVCTALEASLDVGHSGTAYATVGCHRTPTTCVRGCFRIRRKSEPEPQVVSEHSTAPDTDASFRRTIE
ncbi:hypothetical protein PCL_01582 [Purpureocillium lilacinum]|uniref:Fe2OG dioxygenase domain-containing protein n=1 Tax=Purpureocillium lilacinum TaxID=33203 RepID=A0A2U3E1W1_PURLI|nr:hypothetical protein PCL_01582 [Purpureocillium lilacinum]